MEDYGDFFVNKVNDYNKKDTSVYKKLSNEQVQSMKVFCYANYPNCDNCIKQVLCEEHFNNHPPFAGTKDY